ncbi:phage terminase small subunit [Clostridium sp.]|uniref:phage terminase small subunit n=1 Tax=Clostridium sp. TaxID=1506 RepID=UPI003A128BAA
MNEPRAPDLKEQAKYDYLNGMKYKELAEKYDVSLNTIKSWIKRYGWSKLKKQKGAHQKKKGAPYNNKNAVGHGAPPKNKNAEKHGFFSKYLPEETINIIQEINEKGPLDVLWENIQIQYAAIIRAQQIMYVKDEKDKTVEKVEEKRGKLKGERWEVQQAWDKQATFLQAQSRAMSELRSLIKQYDEMLHNNWDKATEEQKLRIEKLRCEVDKVKNHDEDKSNDGVLKEMLEGLKNEL